MSISDKIQALETSRQAIATAITQKGGTVAQGDGFSQFATEISNLPSGGSGNPILKSIDVSDFTGTTFNRASSYITSITLPNGLTTIVDYAFSACSGLTSFVIPNTVTSLGASSLYGCSGLTSISVPSSITQIKNQTFYQCSGLTSVTLPNTITSIGNGAFYGCSSLTSIIINATTVPTIVANSNVFGNTNNCPIYVPSASVAAYKAASGWSTYENRIFGFEQVATVDGNPVYNYDLGNKDATTILSTEIVKMPTGTSIEFAEGVTQIGGQLGAYEEVVLPSTFLSFNDTQPINAATTTLTSKATTPPSVERSNLGGSGLTAIYVPSSSVDTYKAHATWSNFASIIQAIQTE